MTPSLRHCSNKYELAREVEKDQLFLIFRMKSSRAVRYDYIYISDGRNKKSVVSYYVLSFISGCCKIHCFW